MGNAVSFTTLSTWGGLSLGSILTSAGIWTLVGGALTYWIRSRPLLLKQRNDADGSLRGDLLERIDKLEAGAAAQVTKIEETRREYEAKIEAKDAAHSAEIGVMRHRMNNLDQSLTMLLTLIEENPERAQQAAKRVREQREKQEIIESAEKSAISAARIVAAGAPKL